MATAAPDREGNQEIETICEGLKALEVSTFDIEVFQQWMNDELANARYKNFMALSHTVKIAQQYHDALKSREPFNLMEVCLGLTEIVSDAVSGIFGNTSRQVCRITLAIMFTPTLEGANIVSLSLEEVSMLFHTNYKNERFYTEGFLRIKDTKTLDKVIEARDSLLEYLSVLFLGVNKEMLEISNTFDNMNLSRWKDLLVLYCHACVFEFLLHSAVIVASTAEGDKQESESWMQSLEEVKERAKEKLAFLSDRGNLASNALLPFQQKKILRMQELSNDNTAVNVVETLRNFLQLDGMPEKMEIKRALEVAKKSRVCLMYHSYENGYNFLFTNESDLPIKIHCGIVGDFRRNGQLFIYNLRQYQHHRVQLGDCFSTGGYFIIYLNGELPSGESPGPMLTESDDELNGFTKIIQFSMSRATTDSDCKIAILDQSGNPEERSNSECYDRMNSGNWPADTLQRPIYFESQRKYYIVACRFDETERFRTIYREWKVILQEYDPIHDMETYD